MSSNNFQKTYMDIAKVGYNLLEYLQEFKNNKLSQEIDCCAEYDCCRNP